MCNTFFLSSEQFCIRAHLPDVMVLHKPQTSKDIGLTLNGVFISLAGGEGGMIWFMMEAMLLEQELLSCKPMSITAAGR
jgi:hypothetical protein